MQLVHTTSKGLFFDYVSFSALHLSFFFFVFGLDVVLEMFVINVSVCIQNVMKNVKLDDTGFQGCHSWVQLLVLLSQGKTCAVSLAISGQVLRLAMLLLSPFAKKKGRIKEPGKFLTG